MPEITERDRPLTLTDVDRLIQGRIRPVPLSFTYRAGLLGVATALTLLQLIYLAMVALAAASAVAYVVFIVPLILASSSVNILALLFIFGPPIALAIVTFFLFKPILAPSAAEPNTIELKREEAPVLFAWVERVCSAIGSPPPRRILIDLEVNAAASLTRGWRGFLTNDLTLTIGLPLLSGLTLKQFSGVLAHEFGHFTQTFGMRLYFTISVIRNWFLRVAYVRDKWDASLERHSNSGDWRVRAVMGLAQGAVSFSRWILRGLQHVASWMSVWFSRQMEFDADRHEAALVGGIVFAETHIRIALLGLSSRAAWQDVNQLWASKLRAADFTALLGYREQSITQECREQLVEGILNEKTDRWGTHPCASDRIRNVEGIQGLIMDALDQPAHVLIEKYVALCEHATEHCYIQSVGGEWLKATPLSATEAIDRTRISAERSSAFQTFFGLEQLPWRWFQLPSADEFAPAEIEVRLRLEPDNEYWTWLETSLNRYAGAEFVRSGGKIQPSGFSLTHGDLAGIEPKVHEARKKVDQEAAKLREFYGGNAHILSKDDAALRRAYEVLSAIQDQLLELRHQWVANSVLRNNLAHLDAATAAEAHQSSLSRLKNTAREIVRSLDREPSPLRESGTLASEILNRPAEEADNLDTPDLAVCLLDGSDRLAEDILAEWCVRSIAKANSSSPQSLPDTNANVSAADTAT